MAVIEDEFLELRLLREAFPQLSLKSIVAAYNAADGSVNAAAGALEQQISGSSEGNGASPVAHGKCDEVLSSGQVCDDDHEGSPRNLLGRSRSRKWTTVARSGTVSSVRACSDTGKKRKRRHQKKKMMNGLEELSPKEEEVPKNDNKELEEFLLSMLSGDLGMDVVRDVIYECEGDPQRSLDSLLAIMSSEATANEREVEERNDVLALWEAFPDKYPEDVERIYKEHGSQLELATNKLLDVNQLTKGKESSYQVLATEVLCSEVLEKLKSSFPSVDPRTLEEVLKTTENDFSAAMNYLSEAGLTPMKEVAQEFLKKVFKPPDPRIEKESDWTEVKVKPKAPRRPSKIDDKISKDGRDNLEPEHASAVEYWSIMKDCFLKATAAYSSGHRSLASHLSEKGRKYRQLALQARDRESKRIFRTKNNGYNNNITIDLHAQHVDEALRLFKLHLDALQAITSVHTLTVITGSGNHAANGKPKLKPAIIAYMNRKGLKWSEVNPGCLILDLHT
ncbi:SMR domain-containing protein At5g58720-like [Selaginella moellendorffii]|uniref:SMR domain-containing protein At5g58720-like n=1 Tax=Selaginella moellendorffii TaxID=88036 RepID=UPI000D1CC64C|nr:SMR domain-containing protein At5g58720-like [Selaginella moellendorffii]|eukprot:XP_024539051.1 SMR domain-containing protein At5g58720-like [Selaginella moellendorffii]